MPTAKMPTTHQDINTYINYKRLKQMNPSNTIQGKKALRTAFVAAALTLTPPFAAPASYMGRKPATNPTGHPRQRG